MLELFDQIEQAATAISAVWKETPHAGIILGTGLGGLVEEMEIAAIDRLRRHSKFPKVDRHEPSRPAGLRPTRRRAGRS